ncbi:MAG TPA: GntR family transcriptional regulator [Gemmatimonadales bacterium]|nr:GntR family transcriptional regulator [Gemmatimonadales bacterium]
MIPRVPLRDEVYRQILDRIHRGELPPGTRVRDADLAAQLGVSRTPIREALLRLVRDGVLDTAMGRGFRVRPIDAAELREVGDILGALEALALRLSPRPSAERLDGLRQVDRRLEQTRGDVSRCLDLEDEWHRVLLEECPNRRLLELITSLRHVPRRYLAAFMRDAGRLSLSTMPHQKILQALQDGGDTAPAVFEQQWRKGLAELEAWVAKSPKTEPPGRTA